MGLNACLLCFPKGLYSNVYCPFSLITKINTAQGLNDREMLRYTIYKITHAALAKCQTGNFCFNVEAVPLARVLCTLCHKGGTSISRVFKMQFVTMCPFTIPKIVEEATGAAFFINMGFTTADVTKVNMSTVSFNFE